MRADRVIFGLCVAALPAMLIGAWYWQRERDQGGESDLTIRASLDGQDARLDLPLTGPTERVAIWFHGQGGDENTRMNEPWLNALRERGWAVASSDFHGSSWGNPASVEDTERLVEWIESETAVTPSLWVAGSMGGAISLNALLTGDVDDPACWYGTMPVVDLGSVSAVPGADDQVADAWGGAVTSNPADMIDALPEIRYQVIASDGDTWVPIDQHGGRLVAELLAAGHDAVLTPAVGEHGDDSHFDAANLTAFAAAC